MKRLAIAGLCLAVTAGKAMAQINAGEQKPEASVPFNMVQVATLRLPWRIAFLPDGRMLITEKVGGLQLVTQQGAMTSVANAPEVLSKGQGGMLGVYLSPPLCHRPLRLSHLLRARRGRLLTRPRTRQTHPYQGHRLA